jgi:hypothetical protein
MTTIISAMLTLGQSFISKNKLAYPTDATPADLNIPTTDIPAIILTDPQGSNFELEERKWNLEGPEWDEEFNRRNERSRSMQYCVQPRPEGETYTQYCAAMTARAYWANCQEELDEEIYWEQARERGRQLEMQEQATDMELARLELGGFNKREDGNEDRTGGGGSGSQDLNGPCDSPVDGDTQSVNSDPQSLMRDGDEFFEPSLRRFSDPEEWSQAAHWEVSNEHDDDDDEPSTPWQL